MGDRPEQRDSDCIDPATGLPMFLTLPKDVAWPLELPVYGSTIKNGEMPSFADGDDGMELVWPKYVPLHLAGCVRAEMVFSWPKDLPALDVIEVSYPRDEEPDNSARRRSLFRTGSNLAEDDA